MPEQSGVQCLLCGRPTGEKDTMFCHIYDTVDDRVADLVCVECDIKRAQVYTRDAKVATNIKYQRLSQRLHALLFPRGFTFDA